MTPYTRFLEIRRLLDEGRPGQAIAKQLRCSATIVSWARSIARRAHPSVLEAWRDGRITQEIAWQMSARAKPDQLAMLAEFTALSGARSRRDRSRIRQRAFGKPIGAAALRRPSMVLELLTLMPEPPSEFDLGVQAALRWALCLGPRPWRRTKF